MERRIVASDTAPLCEVRGCGQRSLVRCARCDRSICRQHVVADFTYLPGGQRPYCLDCDQERRTLYQAVRFAGARTLLGSGTGAVAGAALGYVGAAATISDSFTRSVVTDIGFMAGLVLGLLWSLKRDGC